MNIRRIVITGAAALALVAGGTAAGATIVASPIDGSGVIHGCYHKPDVNGSSQVVLQDASTTCPKGTTAITWNQTGPQGPKGDTGAPGTGATVAPLGSGDPNCANGGASVTDGSGNTAYACNGAQGPKGDAGSQGPPGPSGTSQGYTYFRYACSPGNCNEIAANGSPLTSVGALNLPAGQYMVEASLDLFNGADFPFANNSREIQCQLSSGAPTPESAYVFVNGNDTASPYATLTMTVALSADQPFTASLDCAAITGGTDQSFVIWQTVRINAIALDNLQSQ